MKISGRTLLFVEDDKRTVEQLSEHFSHDNAVIFVHTIDEAIKYLHFISFDALILDMVLPDGSGMSLLRTIKELPPTVVYSTLDTEYDIIAALKAGAIDYIVKPCSMRVLEAKVKLRLRPSKKATISSAGLVLNPMNRTARFLSATIPLTASEFNILYFLMSHSGTFFSSDEIYERIWNAKSLGTATIRKHMSSLRPKLQEACPNRDFLVNEFGHGYAFMGEVTYE